jgi:hypothetical protein
MNLFSDNKRIIKNNFQIILSPTTVKKEPLVTVEEPIITTTTIGEEEVEVEVELYHIYEPETTTHNNTIDETNPMIKSK